MSATGNIHLMHAELIRHIDDALEYYETNRNKEPHGAVECLGYVMGTLKTLRSKLEGKQ